MNKHQRWSNVCHILGMALAWTTMLVSVSFQYFNIGYDGNFFNATTIFFCLGGAIASFLVVDLIRKGSSVSFPPLLIGSILFALGNSVVYASMVLTLLPSWLAYPFSIIQGAGSSLFVLSWIQISSNLFPETFVTDIALSLTGGAVLLPLIAIIHNIPRFTWFWPFFAVAISALSLLCSCATIRSKTARLSELSIQCKITNHYFLPIPILLSLGMTGFVIQFSHAGIEGLRTDAAVAASVITALVTLVSFLFIAHAFSAKHRTDKLIGLAFFIAIAGILVNASIPDAAAPISIAFVFSGCFCAFFSLLVMLKSASERQGVNKSYAFALGFFAFYLGGSFAKLCLAALSSADDFFNCAYLDPRVLLPIVALIAIAVIFFSDGDSSTAHNPRQDEHEWNPEQAGREIAKRYALTQRQSEVLALLIQGQRAGDIEKSLSISNGTARSHIRAIYEKCEVHSRAELMTLVMNRTD